MTGALLPILARDLRLAARRRIESLLPVAFFLVAVSLFPLGVGPEPQTLRAIAPGIVWVCALMATMLSVHTLYTTDLADGSLEQMLLTPASAVPVALAKALGHWLVAGLPLIVASPVIGLLFGLSGPALGTLVLSLLLGTPVLSLLGGLGAALTLGLRSGGMLLILIVLLIFITQNTASTQFTFLTWHWDLPLGVAILLAAVGGGLITALVSAARMFQLRRAAKKNLLVALKK